MIAEEVEPACLMGREQLGQDQPAKQTREDLHREQVTWPAGDPTLAVERETSAGHDHVDMRMVHERRAPGMQHRGKPDAGAKMLGIGRDREHRLGGSLEQDVVNDGLVLVGDGGDLGRHREHHMEVGHRQ